MKSTIFLILLAGLQGAVCAAAGAAEYVPSSSGTSPDEDARESRESMGECAVKVVELTPDVLAEHDAAHGGGAGTVDGLPGGAGAASGGGRQDADAHSMHAGLHERDDKHLKANRYLRNAEKMLREARSTFDVKTFLQARKLYAHAGSVFAEIARDEKYKEEKVNLYFTAGKAYLFAADYKKAGRCFASVRKHFTDVNPDEVDVWDFELYGYTAITDIFLDNKKHFETYLQCMMLLHNSRYVRTWMRTHFTEALQSLLPADRVVFVERYQEFMREIV